MPLAGGVQNWSRNARYDSPNRAAAGARRTVPCRLETGWQRGGRLNTRRMSVLLGRRGGLGGGAAFGRKPELGIEFGTRSCDWFGGGGQPLPECDSGGTALGGVFD